LLFIYDKDKVVRRIKFLDMMYSLKVYVNINNNGELEFTKTKNTPESFDITNSSIKIHNNQYTVYVYEDGNIIAYMMQDFLDKLPNICIVEQRCMITGDAIHFLFYYDRYFRCYIISAIDINDIDDIINDICINNTTPEVSTSSVDTPSKDENNILNIGISIDIPDTIKIESSVEENDISTDEVDEEELEEGTTEYLCSIITSVVKDIDTDNNCLMEVPREYEKTFSELADARNLIQKDAYMQIYLVCNYIYVGYNKNIFRDYPEYVLGAHLYGYIFKDRLSISKTTTLKYMDIILGKYKDLVS